MESKINRLNTLIDIVQGSTRSDFYRDIWGSKTKARDVTELPVCRDSNLSSTPLHKRTYFSRKGVVKIINHQPQFLIERTLTDLAEEWYGGDFKKPLVLFADPQEALEKSLWCYEQNILPLIGEGDITVALHSAFRYGIDALVTDKNMLQQFLSILPKEHDLSGVRLVLIDTRFDTEVVVSLISNFLNAQYILEAPEAGAYAVSCAQALGAGELVFHENKYSIVEPGEETVITKTVSMPTPIIRYVLPISTQAHLGCACGRDGFALL